MTQEERSFQLDAASLRYFQWDFERFSSIKKNHLEIGFGNGEYIADMAARYSDELFIGIEQSDKYFEKAARRVRTYHLRNVKLIRSEAKTCLGIFPDGFFDMVHINFPDPWPKRRHNSKRFADDSFAAEIRRILNKEGTVLLASDFQEYFFNIVLFFERSGFYKSFLNNYPNPERASKTKYEKEFQSTGVEIFYAVLKKS